MNLNQAAHGDREYGFINARLKKNNKVVVGYWERENVQTQIVEWMDVAVAYNESFSIKVARFGDNMRNVAVTEGDKVEAQIQFGWTVDYYGIRDLVDYVDAVADEEVDALFNEYKDLYDFMERINLKSVNKKVLESLALSGALDNLSDFARYQYTSEDEKGVNFFMIHES